LRKAKYLQRKLLTKKIPQRLKVLVPFEIKVGVLAVALFINLNDVKALVNLRLLGIIGGKIITAILAWLNKPKLS
jgi:hypothetical protein